MTIIMMTMMITTTMIMMMNKIHTMKKYLLLFLLPFLSSCNMDWNYNANYDKDAATRRAIGFFLIIGAFIYLIYSISKLKKKEDRYDTKIHIGCSLAILIVVILLLYHGCY